MSINNDFGRYSRSEFISGISLDLNKDHDNPNLRADLRSPIPKTESFEHDFKDAKINRHHSAKRVYEKSVFTKLGGGSKNFMPSSNFGMFSKFGA